MTPTLLSLVSIVVGILGAYALAWYKPVFSLGLTGNTIVGVFGSVLLTKSFGRLGFDPLSIVSSADYGYVLFFVNMTVSLFGGMIGLVVVRWVKGKLKM